MNSTIQSLPIAPRHRAVSASHTAGTVSAWAAKVGWSVWCGLQSYGARRALREMRLMGIGIGRDLAQPTDVKATAGQPRPRR